eukprot:354246-Chlamydomonas_euryale.AAC.2
MRMGILPLSCVSRPSANTLHMHRPEDAGGASARVVGECETCCATAGRAGTRELAARGALLL